MPEVRAQIIVSAKDDASANLKKVGDAGAKLGKDLNKGLADGIQAATGLNVASLSLAGGMAALGVGLKYAIDQAAEAERVMAQTEAVVKSTGGAAGLTADQIAAMAGRLSQLSAVDDEAIQSGANLLLTFKAVKSDAFEPAMQAALDMSIAMGTDLKGAVIQVGKALEDPVRGLTALRRSGVSFTQEQQNVIKALVATGKSAEAQKLILEELNKQFGGSAQAAASTYSGQMALLKINFDNLAQSVGEKLLPVLTEATSTLNLLLTWNNKVTAALTEHETEVLNTATSYDAYREEIIRARLESGLYAEQVEVTSSGVRRYAADMGLLTEAQFASRFESSEAARAADRLASAEYLAAKAAADGKAHWEALAESLGITGAGADALTLKFDSIRDSGQLLDAALNGEMAAAQAAYQQALADTSGSIVELNTRQAEAEAQLKLTTAQFIFQQIAAYLDKDAALEVARSLGLVDETSYNTAKALLELTNKFDANRDGMIDATEATPEYIAALGFIQTKAVAAAEGHSINLTPAILTTKDKMIEAAEKADAYRDALNRLNGTSATTTVTTNYQQNGSPSTYVPPPAPPPGYTPPAPQPQAFGGDYLVTRPTLFMAGEAGPEQATFTPLGSRGGGGRGNDDVLLMLPAMLELAVSNALARSGRTL